MEVRKRILWSILTVLVLIAILTGIFYYISAYDKEEVYGKGTLVSIENCKYNYGDIDEER